MRRCRRNENRRRPTRNRGCSTSESRLGTGSNRSCGTGTNLGHDASRPVGGSVRVMVLRTAVVAAVEPSEHHSHPFPASCDKPVPVGVIGLDRCRGEATVLGGVAVREFALPDVVAPATTQRMIVAVSETSARDAATRSALRLRLVGGSRLPGHRQHGMVASHATCTTGQLRRCRMPEPAFRMSRRGAAHREPPQRAVDDQVSVRGPLL